MGLNFELDDVMNDKAVVRSEVLQGNNATGAIRTTQSQSSNPQQSLTAFDVSSVLQGAALYKPKGATYDAFNNHLSGELEGLGTEARWKTRDSKLLPYDILLKDVDPSTAAATDVGNIGGAMGTTPTNTSAVATAPPLTGGSAEGFVVGDSITVGCKPYLEANDKGWKLTVDCVGGRQPSVGIEQLKARNGNFGSLVIVNLGTNRDAKQPAQWIGEVMALLTNVPRVCWVTCVEWTEVVKTSNQEIHNLATRDSKVVLVDWASYIAQHKNLLQPDGIHGATGETYKILTGMIMDAVGPAPKGTP